MGQRIQQQTLDTIRNEHKILLLSMNEPEGVNVEQVNRFVQKLVQAGEVVERNEDRSLLQELLRYWSSIINDKTGKYLVVHLHPFELRSRRNSWKVATLVLLILTILLSGTTVLLFTRVSSAIHVLGRTPTPQIIGSGSIVTNITLTCGGCNDPIHVTISTIQIDNTNGRMIWNTTLKDITASGRPYSIKIYTLQALFRSTFVSDFVRTKYSTAPR
jgi:hypothetical protein